jgi:hypothetical protein
MVTMPYLTQTLQPSIGGAKKFERYPNVLTTVVSVEDMFLGGGMEFCILAKCSWHFMAQGLGWDFLNSISRSCTVVVRSCIFEDLGSSSRSLSLLILIHQTNQKNPRVENIVYLLYSRSHSFL